MPAHASFDYATLRVVPRVEREEFINVAVIVFCLEKRYLEARIHLDESRLLALFPDVDVELIRHHLEAIRRICEGDPTAGPIAHCRCASASTGSYLRPQHHPSALGRPHRDLYGTEGLLDRLAKQFL